MKAILVPTDFSDNARKALNYAANLAQRCGSRLHLVHAYSLLENTSPEKLSMRKAYNKQQQQEKAAFLLQEKQFVSEQHPNLHVEVHLFTGVVETVLKKFTEDYPIELIIMGTQGATGLAEVIVGSVTASVIEKSEVPVLAIPEGYTGNAPENILLSVRDFNQDATKLKPAFEMAALYDVPMHVFAFESDMDSDSEISERTHRLEDYLKFLQKEFPLARLKGNLSEDEDFEYAIEDYCDKHKIGMICMLTHKRDFWGKLFNPSLTKKMAYHTTIPLLAIPC